MQAVSRACHGSSKPLARREQKIKRLTFVEASFQVELLVVNGSYNSS